MTEAKSKPPKIYAALAGVMHDLKELPKGDHNRQQNYDYRGIDSLMNLAHTSMDKHKIIVLPEVLSEPIIELGPVAKSGAQMYRSLVKVQYTFLSTEDGTKVVSGPFIGEATDMADKATNKAQTAAYKWCFFQTFCMPTNGSMSDSEGDDESNEGAPPPKPKPKAEPKKETPADKDERHRTELTTILKHMAAHDDDPAERVKRAIREWTTYEKDGKEVYQETFRDTSDPKGKAWDPTMVGTRLNIVTSKARVTYGEWLGVTGEKSRTKGAK